MSNISPLTICIRVGNSIQLLDPATLQTSDIPAHVYWRTPFLSLASVTDLVEFTVLDIDPDRSRTKGKFVLADAQVALASAFQSRKGKSDDDDMMDYDAVGSSSQIFHTRTHLGAILQPGDTVLGYFLSNSNYNSEDFANLPQDRIPDVMLVKKTYPNRRKKNRSRKWKLRSIAKEPGEEGETSSARGAIGRLGGRDRKKVEEDYEIFLRDLEEDPELRSGINLYKAEEPKMETDVPDRKTKKKIQFAMEVDDTPAVPVPAELAEDTEEDEGEEPDFPEVKLEELLEGFDELTLAAGEGEGETQA